MRIRLTGVLAIVVLTLGLVAFANAATINVAWEDVPDNFMVGPKYYDGDIYSFLGGVNLDPGAYNLNFSFTAIGNISGNDNEVQFQVELDNIEIAGEQIDNISAGLFKTIFGLLQFSTNSGGLLTVEVEAGFSNSASYWQLVSASLVGTRTTPDIGSAPSPSPTPVPEPGTILLLGSGLTGLSVYQRRKAKKA